MHSDEMATLRDITCPTAEHLNRLAGGRMKLNRKTIASIADHLINCNREKDSALLLLDKFEKQIYGEKLYMMDEVFLPEDFGFHYHIEEDKDTRAQYILYIGDNAILSRTDEDMGRWSIKSTTMDIKASISNSFEAYTLFNCLGIAYKIAQY